MVTAKLHTDDGITVEVDAPPEEYEIALLTTLRAIRGAVEPTPRAGAGASAAAFHQMVDRLSEETIDYLRLLADYPEGLTDVELREALGIDSRRKLAGMNGAVTKVAENAGIDAEIITRTVTRKADGTRQYHYVIPPDVRQRLASALPEEPEAEPEPEPTGSWDGPPPPSDDEVPF